jgi:DNA-directed RNA polymerase specialized sigma24 family protein
MMNFLNASDGCVAAQNFENAYRDGYRRTVLTLQRIGAKGDQAWEIAQAAWSRAWAHLPELRDHNRLLAWVNAIARRIWLTSLRRHRLIEISQLRHEPALAERFNPALIDLERALLIEGLLNGYSQCELAKLSGKSLPAIHAELCRARKALRKHMRVTRQAGPDDRVFRKKIPVDDAARFPAPSQGALKRVS